MFIIVGLLLSVNLINAQKSYADKKEMYNYMDYSWQQGDRYNPTIASVLSLAVPGLGQITSGEAGRGLLFLVPGVVAEVVMYNTVEKFEQESIISKKKEYDSQVIFSGIVVIGLSIWSAIDAANVAKVNNMYFRDKSKNDVSFKIKPYTNILPNNNVGYGLSFAISF